MYTVKVWWAGHVLRQVSVPDDAGVAKHMAAWQHEIDTGGFTHTSCGVLMTPSSFCVDVLMPDVLVAQHQLKRA